MDKKLTYGVIGAILGGLAVWLILPTPPSGRYSSLGQMMWGKNTVQENRITNSDALDSHFIEQMIPHHKDAITMSTTALEKATHSEIKTLAQNIITAQSKEIEQMKGWYEEWFGKQPPEDNDVMDTHGMMQGNGSMHMGMMGSDIDAESLKSAENFDKEFIEEMIPHHQMAVMMATMLKNGTIRPEMKKLAQNIIDSQTKEINQMRLWYKEWGY